MRKKLFTPYMEISGSSYHFFGGIWAYFSWNLGRICIKLILRNIFCAKQINSEFLGNALLCKECVKLWNLQRNKNFASKMRILCTTICPFYWKPKWALVQLKWCIFNIWGTSSQMILMRIGKSKMQQEWLLFYLVGLREVCVTLDIWLFAA